MEIIYVFLDAYNLGSQLSRAVTQRERLVPGLCPRKHGFDPGQSTWDLWWIK
jgi:hypothetical protein